MRLFISSRHIANLIEFARAAHPHECCGLILGRGDQVLELRPAANISPTPSHRFEIDPAELLTAQKSERAGGPALIGYYHSHPNGRSSPSPFDAAMALPDGRIWLIIAGGELFGWRAVENGPLHRRFAPITLNS